MSNAEIVCIGDELLTGDIADVHGAFLARFLTERGIAVTRISLVADDYQSILGALAAATARVRLLVVTGGLGPTSDDQTRDALGLLVGQRPEFDAKLSEEIQATLGRALTGSNRQQAFRPAAFEPLTNAFGTAPGLMADVGGCRVVALPGPPRELRGMLANHAQRIVEGIGADRPAETVLTCFGVPESRIEDVLREASPATGAGGTAREWVSWHTRAEPLRIVLRLVGSSDEERATVVRRLRDAFGEERFASGEVELAADVVRRLEGAGKRLAVAESCTGGMIGSTLTDVPGSSSVFWGSAVTYSNEAKIRLLGVSETMLGTHGAVSEEIVGQMAAGVRSMAGTSLSIAVSGIAGPSGGTEQKPVGTVWIGIAWEDGRTVRLFHFHGDRARVRRGALTESLLMVRRHLMLA